MFRAQLLGGRIPRHSEIGIAICSDEEKVRLGGSRARKGLEKGSLAVDGAGVSEDEAIGRLGVELQTAGLAVVGTKERSTESSS